MAPAVAPAADRILLAPAPPAFPRSCFFSPNLRVFLCWVGLSPVAGSLGALLGSSGFGVIPSGIRTEICSCGLSGFVCRAGDEVFQISGRPSGFLLRCALWDVYSLIVLAHVLGVLRKTACFCVACVWIRENICLDQFPLTGFPLDATDLLQKLSLDPKSAAGEGKDAKKKVRARLSLYHLVWWC